MEGMAEDKCALVAELVQVLEMVRQLEAHMVAAGQQAAGHQQLQVGGGGGGGDQQRCRALVSAMRAAIDRAVHMAMTASCCAAEGRRLAAGHGGHPESPPSGGDGSPRSAGSDQAGAGANAAGGSQCKKRKMLPRVSTQVRVSAVQDVSTLDDGLSWRKYGQKDILGAKYPRAYFRCTHRHTQSCHASKQVQRTDADPLLFDVVYIGTHTCAQGAAAHPSRQNHGAPAPAAEHAQAQPPAADRVPPFSLVDDAGAATSGRFAVGGGGGRVFASSSPETPQCLQVSSSYAVGGGGGVTSVAGVRNLPDVELVSSTSSPMGDMEFMFPLDTADFLENPSSYF